MRGFVVLNLISELPTNKPCDIYFDNLFISPTLINELSGRNIGASGSIRSIRTEN